MFTVPSYTVKEKKQKYILLFSLCLAIVLYSLFSSHASASSNDLSKLYIIKQDGKYGYINGNGKVIIKPIYLKAKEFAEGVAPVMLQEGTWGLLNTEGKIIGIWKNVDEIDEFSEGLAVVRRGVKYGYVDKTKLIIPIKFDGADAFSEGMAVVAIREGNTLAERLTRNTDISIKVEM